MPRPCVRCGEGSDAPSRGPVPALTVRGGGAVRVRGGGLPHPGGPGLAQERLGTGHGPLQGRHGAAPAPASLLLFPFPSAAAAASERARHGIRERRTSSSGRSAAHTGVVSAPAPYQIGLPAAQRACPRPPRLRAAPRDAAGPRPAARPAPPPRAPRPRARPGAAARCAAERSGAAAEERLGRQPPAWRPAVSPRDASRDRGPAAARSGARGRPPPAASGCAPGERLWRGHSHFVVRALPGPWSCVGKWFSWCWGVGLRCGTRESSRSRPSQVVPRSRLAACKPRDLRVLLVLGLCHCWLIASLR